MSVNILTLTSIRENCLPIGLDVCSDVVVMMAGGFICCKWVVVDSCLEHLEKL